MKTNIVVLAAGNSTRFLENKLLYTWNDKPLITHVLDVIQTLEINDVYVINQNDAIHQLAIGYGYKSIHNNNPELGMSHSIKLGVNVSKEADQILFVVGDQPFLRQETLNHLLSMSDGKHIVCCECNASLQNPMLFPQTYYEQLLSLTDEQGGRFIATVDNTLRLEVDEKELFDIDTKNDYEKASQL